MDTWLDPQWLIPYAAWSLVGVYLLFVLYAVVSKINDFRFSRQVRDEYVEINDVHQRMRLNADNYVPDVDEDFEPNITLDDVTAAAIPAPRMPTMSLVVDDEG
jgi:hypothetical protein